MHNFAVFGIYQAKLSANLTLLEEICTLIFSAHADWREVRIGNNGNRNCAKFCSLSSFTLNDLISNNNHLKKNILAL